MKLSIVVPFYNEAKNIPLVLDAFQEFARDYDFELICVNDGSKDESAEIFGVLESAGTYPFARFISYSPNGGYGHAIMTGVKSAVGEVISWTHSDLQTHPKDVFRAYDEYVKQDNPNVVIKGKRINRTFQQVILSYGMACIATTILRNPLVEINAQPKLFSAQALSLLEGHPTDFSLDLFLLHKAKKTGYKIHSIPVAFPDRLHGESSWAFSFRSKAKTIWRTIKYIWKLR